MSRVLVFCETEDGVIRKGSRQALSAANRLAGATVEALLIGSDAESVAAKAGELGATKAIAVKVNGDYNTAVWTAAAVQAVGDGDCIFLASHTAIARDFAPRLAGRLGAPHIADAIDMSGGPGNLEAKRPIYAGKAFETIKTSNKQVVVTLRPNAFAEEAAGSGSAAVTNQAAPSPDASLMTVVKETLAAAGGKIELTEADIIVSGGIGVGGPAGFEMLQKELCEPLGAALGASRAAVLAGWIAPEHQVGQTGKVVSPQLYIAAGISGAIQHRAGMSSSKVIVAINKDPQAPIFEIADYGIVADLNQVVPALGAAIKKIKG